MYGLKVDNFIINPKEEYEVFFAREAEFQRFFDDLVATMDSGRVPRYVVFGLFGVGKTHFLLHLRHKIGSRVDAFYVETPSCHRRTRFVDFYRAILSVIGRGTVMKLLTSGLKEHRRGLELGLTEDVRYVINNALSAKKHFVLWKWLMGEKLKASEAEELEAVRAELGDEDAVSILNALAILYEQMNRRAMLILVDEFENTAHIGGDAKTSFSEAMRSLVDESSKVGVIFALTSRALAEMPEPIDIEPVKRRIGITNYVSFREYTEDELERFIEQLIRYRRDSKFDFRKTLGDVRFSENMNESTYPFTTEAVKQIVSSVILFKEQNKTEAVRPKEVMELMDRALREAVTKKLQVISSDVILGIRDQVVEALKL